MADCEFARDRFAARVGDAELAPGLLAGSAGDISWDLRYSADERPLLLLAPKFYAGRFPKAKSLVTVPLASYSGTCPIGARRLDVDGWVGSQNHNWGSEHTDRYAFGQVAGFDGAPGQLPRGRHGEGQDRRPVTTPWLTTLVLRHEGREHSLVALRRAFAATARYRLFEWDFASATKTSRSQDGSVPTATHSSACATTIRRAASSTA